MTRRALRGFTLVELMVVTTIMGMLIAMLFPAVHAARMGMRRAVCLNNLRNLGEATLRYVKSSKRDEFPGWRQAVRLPHGGGQGSSGDEMDINKRLTVVSWGVTLLPFLDRDDLYRQFMIFVPLNSTTNAALPRRSAYLEVYVCPSDYPEPRFENPLSYVANCGQPDPAWGSVISGTTTFATDPLANGVFHDLRPHNVKDPNFPRAGDGPDPSTEVPYVTFTMSMMRDGTEKTLMFSENLINPHDLGTPTVIGEDPLIEVNGGTVPYRTWTGIQLLATASQQFVGFQNYAERIDTPIQPQFAPRVEDFSGLAQTGASVGRSIQEWLIGMVWMPQPSTPLPQEWSTNLLRINRWDNGNFNLSTSYIASRPASNHHAGVNVVFCDGHTGWLRQDIYYWVYMQLMTPDGDHACGPNLKSDNPSAGPWNVARVNLGGATNVITPYILDDRDYK